MFKREVMFTSEKGQFMRREKNLQKRELWGPHRNLPHHFKGHAWLLYVCEKQRHVYL